MRLIGNERQLTNIVSLAQTNPRYHIMNGVSRPPFDQAKVAMYIGNEIRSTNTESREANQLTYNDLSFHELQHDSYLGLYPP